jgi:hypothetical protein
LQSPLACHPPSNHPNAQSYIRTARSAPSCCLHPRPNCLCSYGRSFNPTVRYLGRQLAALEGGEAAYCCASGMAAISATLLALCDSGDHIVCSNAVYGGTFALMKVSRESGAGGGGGGGSGSGAGCACASGIHLATDCALRSLVALCPL